MEQTELTPIQEEVKKRNNKSNALTIKIILIALLIIALIIQTSAFAAVKLRFIVVASLSLNR